MNILIIKKTKNYHDNSYENNAITRGNKKYITYNIDQYDDIENFDAHNMEDIFKKYNRDDLQNNTFKQWNPNDTYDNLDIQNKIDIAGQNCNIQNSIVQDMYNNAEKNINEQVNKMFKLKNNSNFQ